MKKLTLSADPEVIEQAKQLAAESGTSVSALFGRFIRLLAEKKQRPPTLGRSARAASGMIRIPRGKSDREILADALAEKYGTNR